MSKIQRFATFQEGEFGGLNLPHGTIHKIKIKTLLFKDGISRNKFSRAFWRENS